MTLETRFYNLIFNPVHRPYPLKLPFVPLTLVKSGEQIKNILLRIYVLSSLDHLLLHLVFDLSAYDRLFQQQLGLKGFCFI